MYVIDFPASSCIAIFLEFILFKSFAIFLVIKPTSNEIPPFQFKKYRQNSGYKAAELTTRLYHFLSSFLLIWMQDSFQNGKKLTHLNNRGKADDLFSDFSENNQGKNQLK